MHRENDLGGAWGVRAEGTKGQRLQEGKLRARERLQEGRLRARGCRRGD